MTDIQVVRCRACDSWHLGAEAAKAISAMASELPDLRAKLKVAEEALDFIATRNGNCCDSGMMICCDNLPTKAKTALRTIRGEK